MHKIIFVFFMAVILGSAACSNDDDDSGDDDDMTPLPCRPGECGEGEICFQESCVPEDEACEPCEAGAVCEAGLCVLDLPQGILHAAAAGRITTPDYWETYDDANGDQAFNGLVDLPNPAPATGYEGFDDANGNGMLDTYYLAGKTYARALGMVHDDTEAKILLLGYNDGDSNRLIAFVGLDAIGYFNDEIQKIHEEIDPALGIDLIVVGASHSHETIDTMGIFGQGPVTTGINLAYNAFIRQQIAEGIEEAAANLVPAEIAFGDTPTGIEGYLYDGRDPAIIEDRMTVMDVRAASDQSPIAFFINWHSHPEMLSKSNELTRDWVGYLRDEIEARVPGTTAVFFNGLVGGQIGSNGAMVVRDGVEYRQNGYEKMEMLGKNLADIALDIPLDPQVDPALRFKTDSFFIPVDNTLYKLVFSLGVIPHKQPYDYVTNEPITDRAGVDIEDRFNIKTDIAYIELGAARMITIPGEMHPEIAVGGYDGSKTGPLQPLVQPDNPNPPPLEDAPAGPYLVERMGGEYRFFLGLSMDMLGYVVPAYNFQVDPDAAYFGEPDGDHYEETNSIGPEFEPVLVQHLNALLAEEE